MGPLRPPDPAALIPLRRDGEPVPDLCHPDPHRRRPVPDQRRRARDRALVVGQPGDQPHVGVLLDERGLHGVRRAQDPPAHVRGPGAGPAVRVRVGGAVQLRRVLRPRPQLHGPDAASRGRRRPRRRVLPRPVRKGLRVRVSFGAACRRSGSFRTVPQVLLRHPCVQAHRPPDPPDDVHRPFPGRCRKGRLGTVAKCSGAPGRKAAV
mmetsp:Transcript_94304/g.158300  ORF Transcript_94304/g.158300 Transcript_94304/m.158300 type:complete len:207 (+) Transcript_94304:424-1044(+)